MDLNSKLQIITQNVFNEKHNYQFYDVEKHEFLQVGRRFEFNVKKELKKLYLLNMDIVDLILYV